MKKLIQTRTSYQEYIADSIVCIDARFSAKDILDYLCNGLFLKHEGFIFLVEDWIWFYDFKLNKSTQIGTIDTINDEEFTKLSYELEEE